MKINFVFHKNRKCCNFGRASLNSFIGTNLVYSIFAAMSTAAKISKRNE